MQILILLIMDKILMIKPAVISVSTTNNNKTLIINNMSTLALILKRKIIMLKIGELI